MSILYAQQRTNSMSDTLLERLRVQQEWFSDGHGPLHKEAADRIERLELALRACAADYISPECTISDA